MTIQYLNDQLRANIFTGLSLCANIFTGLNGKILLTQGIAGMPEADRTAILTHIRDFNVFTKDNDPYGEHDFGSLEHAGEKIFWKIDYYDLNMECGSEDPANPAVTTRVLTIMLANEY